MVSRLQKSVIKRIGYFLVLFMLTPLLVIQPVRAQSAPEEGIDYGFYNSNDILWYNPNAKCAPAGSSESSNLLTDPDNEKNLIAIYNYFLGKGLRDIEAAAIVGNIYQESGGNPLLYQPTEKSFDGDISTLVGPGGEAGMLGRDAGMGKAWGLVQWDPGAVSLYWQKQAGVQGNIKDLGVQLDVIWWQLQNKAPTSAQNVLAKMKQGSTVEEIVQIFCKWFEGAGIPNYPRRNAAAIKALGYPKDPSIAKTASTATTTASSDCNVQGGAAGTVSADGYAFPIGVPKAEAYNFSKWPCGPVCHHDGSGAVDLTKKPGNDTGTSVPVFAITDGRLRNVRNSYQGQEGCNTFQLVGKDGWQYWYGHIQKASPEGTEVKAGQQIAVIGERRCTGNGSAPHLHIDRGLPKGSPGGTLGRRDPELPKLIDQLYGGLE